MWQFIFLFSLSISLPLRLLEPKYAICSQIQIALISHWQPSLTYSGISMPFQWQSWKIPIHSVESFSHFYLSSIETSLLWRISRSKAHQLEVYQVHLSLSLSFPLVLRHNALIPASSPIPILFGGLPSGFQKSSADVRCNVVYVYGFDICFFLLLQILLSSTLSRHVTLDIYIPRVFVSCLINGSRFLKLLKWYERSRIGD